MSHSELSTIVLESVPCMCGLYSFAAIHRRQTAVRITTDRLAGFLNYVTSEEVKDASTKEQAAACKHKSERTRLGSGAGAAANHTLARTFI